MHGSYIISFVKYVLFYNDCKNSRALIGYFSLSISGQTHKFIIYAIMTRYCSRQIEVSSIFVSLSSRVLTDLIGNFNALMDFS